jgi:hypothetical protein
MQFIFLYSKVFIMYFIKKAVFYILNYFGFGIYRKASLEKLSSLTEALRPLITEYDLIRVGGESDGGYLIPNDLEGVDALFSPGTGGVAEFEAYFAERGFPCYLMDYSVSNPPLIHQKVDFTKKYLGIKDYGNFKTLESWIYDKNIEGNELVLQMDIEGSEWDVIKYVSVETLKRFRILIIEFHGFAQRFDSDSSYEENINILNKILSEFLVLHTHINNCCDLNKVRKYALPDVIEITFLRKNRVKNITGYSRLPHHLDRDNVDSNPTIKTPFYWR